MGQALANTRKIPAIPACGSASLQIRQTLDALDDAYATGFRRGIIRRAASRTEYPTSEVGDIAGLLAVAGTRAYFTLRLMHESADEQAQALMAQILGEVA